MKTIPATKRERREAERLQVENRARRAALAYLFTPWYSILHKRPRPDMRTIYGRAYWSEFCRLVNDPTTAGRIADALKKQRQRAKARNEMREAAAAGILNNKIWQDFRANRGNVWQIFPDHLHFYGGRNHWATTPQDFRVLEVIARHWAGDARK